MALSPQLLNQLHRELEADEARRAQPYDDQTGKPPVLAKYERGRLIPTGGKVSIGIGRNLTDRLLSAAVIDLLFEEDIAIAEGIVRRLFPDFDSFTQNRKAATLNLLTTALKSKLPDANETENLGRLHALKFSFQRSCQ